MDSIIFDLDGTLWDATEASLKAWNEVIKNYKEIELTKKELESIMGLQIEEIGMRLFPNVPKERQQKILGECAERECIYLAEKGGRLYDNVVEVLNLLSKKYKLFIVSNCECGYIEAFFKYHKVDKYFIDFEHPGRTGLPKGENIKGIIDRYGLKKAVYVGDTEIDQRAAKFAGIPFIYARYGFGKAEQYDYAIDAFEELLTLF